MIMYGQDGSTHPMKVSALIWLAEVDEEASSETPQTPDLRRHFLVNFDLTSEIWRGMGTVPLSRGDNMRWLNAQFGGFPPNNRNNRLRAYIPAKTLRPPLSIFRL
jgi:hypothetical protein